MAHGSPPPVLATSGPPALEVLSVSDRNPNVRTVRVPRPPREDSSFLPATLKGLSITVKHFFKNVLTKSEVETIQYPEEKKAYPARNRGLHRLRSEERRCRE